jgi:predicted RNA-binding protein with PIN domain
MEPKTLLVDGYNVIRRTPALAAAERHSLAGGRDALLTALRASYRHTAHTVIVVFDGDGDAEASQPFGGCRGRVIFSRHDEPADAVLARLAHELAATGARFTIVSDDLEVQRGSRASGGHIASAAELSGRLNAPDAHHRRLMRSVAFVRARQQTPEDDQAHPRAASDRRRRRKGRRDRRV